MVELLLKIKWKYCLLLSASVGFILLLLSNSLVFWYLHGNYFEYVLAFTIYTMLITFFLILFTLPLSLIMMKGMSFLKRAKSQKLSVEEKSALILETVQRYKVTKISPKQLSNLTMLPENDVSRCLNLLVHQKRAEFYVTPEGDILYTLNQDLAEIINKLAKRIFDDH